MASQKPIIILFNYGGGLRGLIPAHIMSEIESRTGLAMTDMVDIFAGPSTGAILNAALNIPCPDEPTRPKFTAANMVEFYEREGAKIFPRDRFREFRAFVHDFNNRTMKIGQLDGLFRHGHYDPKHLGVCMRGLYGQSVLADSIKSLIIPVYNIDGEQLKVVEEQGETATSPVHTRNNFIDEGGYAVWLKNMRVGQRLKPPPDVKLFDAVMASVAAPTYFPCHHFEVHYENIGHTISYTGIDGSIFDNPCISYHGAIHQHLPADRDIVMILLGTGFSVRSISKEQWNSYGGLGVVDPVNDLPLINILFQAPESALAESFRDELGDNLHIFNKSILSDSDHPESPSLSIDDASPENFKRLKAFADTIMEENSQSFDQVCDLLVQVHEGTYMCEEKPKSFWSFFSK